MTDTTLSTGNDDTELVPMAWPPMRTDTPTPVRTVKGLPALPGMVLLWFLPKRCGAPLAAAGWRAAIAAHLLGVTVGLGLIGYALITSSSGTSGIPGFPSFRVDVPECDMTLSESFRAPFVALVTIAHGASATPGGPSRIFLILTVIPAVLLVLTTLMMPFAAAGERLAHLFGRCLRLTLWSTTLAIPLGIGWLLWPQILEWMGVERTQPTGFNFGNVGTTDDQGHSITVVAVFLFALWWLVVLVRSGDRYAGPPDGPAWQPRPPRCGKCSYIIAGISPVTNCPECAKPVPESLSEFQRSLRFTRWNAFVKSLQACFSTLHK